MTSQQSNTPHRATSDNGLRHKIPSVRELTITSTEVFQ